MPVNAVDAGQGLEKPCGLSPASSAVALLCDFTQGILSSVSELSSEDTQWRGQR